MLHFLKYKLVQFWIFLDQISNSCAFCSYSFSMGLVCEKCWGNFLLPKVTDKKNYIFHLKHWYLFEWTSENTFIEKLIYNLKAGFHVNTVKLLAQLLIQQRLKQKRFPKKIKIICSPTAEGVKINNDHSYILARELAQILNCEIYVGLIKNQTQKEKNKKERNKIKIKLTHNFIIDPDVTYVFVDDVVTTGSTAFQTFLSLGRPSQFEVWSYVYRPL